MQTDKFSLKRQLGSFRHALNGVFYFFKNEPKAYVHLIFDGTIIITGFILGFTTLEWIILSMGMVVLLSAELINTSIEELCDFVEKDWHHKIKAVKDMCSGAVMLVALLVGLVFLYITYTHIV